jgi:mycothiol synthase
VTSPGSQPDFVATPALTPAEQVCVTDLVWAATEHDGLHPLSEHVMLHLRPDEPDHDQHFLAWFGDQPDRELVGYAHLDPTDAVAGASGELVVHPRWRRRGIGRCLAERLRQAAPDARLRLWAHGKHPGAQALAHDLGYVSVRELLQLRRSLRTHLPEPHIPPGYIVRTFIPGRDESSWLELNAAAFAHHREQGSWTLADLRHRMAEDWFDTKGFFLVIAPSGELAAFHWTKVHAHDTSDGGGPGAAHEPIGEVYVVGVGTDHRGRGLGGAVTVVGLRHLRAQGLAQAMLYVDADNDAAVQIYERLGFTRWDIDVQYCAVG